MNALTECPVRDRDDINECLRLNMCRICRQTKDLLSAKRHYCRSCADRVKRASRLKKRRIHARYQPQPTPYACTMVCHGPGCKASFFSPDRRRITRCETCQKRLYRVEESLACEEARYETADYDWGSMYRKLAKPVGKMSSGKLFDIGKQQQQEDYAGIPFRKLTRAEIDATYTPDRIAVMLVRAKKNQITGWVPDERSL